MHYLITQTGWGGSVLFPSTPFIYVLTWMYNIIYTIVFFYKAEIRLINKDDLVAIDLINMSKTKEARDLLTDTHNISTGHNDDFINVNMFVFHC